MSSVSADIRRPPALSVRLDGDGATTPGEVLADFTVGAGAHPAPTIPLPILAGFEGECWRVAGPVTRLAGNPITAFEGGGLLLCETGFVPAHDLRAQTQRRYEELVDFIETRGYPHIVKAWHYVPGINEGEGDDEPYKQFCIGRAEALGRRGRLDVVPAGTAVGCAPGDPFTMTLVAAARPPAPLENPRQVSAYRYPRRYGPASPSFSRASWVERPGGGLLFISGTASIVGHRSLHAGDVSAQVTEIGRNLDALLARHAERTGRRANPGQGAYRVYLRHPADLATVRTRLRSLGIPPDRSLFLQADICRRELLVEVDALLPAD